MASTSIEATELFVRKIADVAIQNEKYFADLDGVCGDGDFGISLAAGFSKVMEQWDALDRSTPGAMLKGVSMAIASKVGGVSGAIWGTAFLRASIAAGARTDLTAEDVIAMLTASAEGMKKRGQSDLGDKTLLDAFVPASEEFARVVREGGTAAAALKAASVVARQKTEEIKPWVAKRGRASYTGERSCNTYDAGSIAVAMMAEHLAGAWEQSSTVAERAS
jgi:phosphoenolpyruvate---glycerone phosphotransferase subunit DhaL